MMLTSARTTWLSPKGRLRRQTEGPHTWLRSQSSPRAHAPYAGSGVGEEQEVSETYAFSRPNPFRDNAEIVWYQSVAANARIQILSAQGVVLADFGNKFYAEGEHSLNITNAVNWQPDLYFAKIAVDGSQPVVIKLLRQ